MAIRKDIEKHSHIKGFKKEIDKASKISKHYFFTWFNEAKDINTSFIRGSWDFNLHIALPLAKFIKDPENKTILEIGHGGGRILAAASRSFKECIGIDIHEHNKLVENEFKKRGINNVKLILTDGTHIPIENNSIDVVYSFIVLQHVEKIEIFQNYLRETYRVLKPNGIAVLYFGRHQIVSKNKSLKLFYMLDCILERLFLPKGYVELPAPVNSTNLKVSLHYSKKLSSQIGFKILETLVSHKKVPNGINLLGGQHGLVLRK